MQLSGTCKYLHEKSHKYYKNIPNMSYPVTRLRRLRRTSTLRSMIRETIVNKDDLIMPYFVIYGENVRNPIHSMPGNFQLSVDQLVPEVQDLVEKTGVNKILLFGIPETKDEHG